MSEWEVVIGLEVHVQLSSQSKMFCSCAIAEPNAVPNSHVCPVCLGLPGALPVPNGAAIEACRRAAQALHCELAEVIVFARKHYFYPDLPKGFQVSQHSIPMGQAGYLDLERRRIRIRRVHLEEDTGKLSHAGDKLQAGGAALVDLNRAGVPLMEIVSEPDLRSAEEARAYAQALRQLLVELELSKAQMERGQLRLEANVSIRPAGASELGVKTELKNINSFRYLQRAILYEVARQREVLEAGDRVAAETRGWSEAEKRTFVQRSKEEAAEYRYMPEPDIPPIEVGR